MLHLEELSSFYVKYDNSCGQIGFWSISPEITKYSMEPDVVDNIYLDFQSTTPLGEGIADVMMPYFTTKFGNPHSSDHAIGWAANLAVETAAGEISELVGANASEVIFTSGATEANNLAFLGLEQHANSSQRKKILVSAIEHKCVLEAAEMLARRIGGKVEYLEVTTEGHVSLDDLQAKLNDQVLIVSVMLVNNEVGTIQDIEAVSSLVRAHGALLHCDAAQAPIAMDLSGLGGLCDLISISSHKMYGPPGVGALIVSDELIDKLQPILVGGGQQHGLRSGTIPVGLAVGFGAAAKRFASAEVEEGRARLRDVALHLMNSLETLPVNVSLNGPPISKHRHPGNVNVCFHGVDAQLLIGRLQPNVSLSTGSACTSGTISPSHVLRAIGLCAADASSSVRFSVGFSTTRADIDNAIGHIERVVQDFCDIGLVDRK